jgi:hypothetical protein
VLFVVLGSVEGRGDRVITALGQAYSPIDSPCIVVDGEPESAAKSECSLHRGLTLWQTPQKPILL